MDDAINRGIIYGDHPPDGVFFTIVVEYNHTHPIYDGTIRVGESLVSQAFKSFPTAMGYTQQVVDQLIATQISDATVVEVDPDVSKGFLYYLNDDNDVPMARVGIDTHDTRFVTLH